MPVEMSVLVERFQELCEDIVENSFEVEEKFYWSKHSSGFGWYPFPYNFERSKLLENGLLKRIIIGRKYPFFQKIPESVRSRSATTLHLYLLQDKEQLKKLAEEAGSAIEFLGFRPLPTAQPITYKQALECIRKEITAHPEPNQFLIKVIKDLLP